VRLLGRRRRSTTVDDVPPRRSRRDDARLDERVGRGEGHVDTDTARERSEVRARDVGEGQSAEGRRREGPREDRIRGGAEVLEIRAGDALLSLREARRKSSRNRALDRRVTNPELAVI
jgi:hypothetical protein